MAAAEAGHTVQIFDAETGQPAGPPLRGHDGHVQSIAYSPDGHRIATGSADKTVRIWDADTGQPIGAPLRGHDDMVNSVAYSPDGHRIATASADKTVRIWDADTGQPIGAPLPATMKSVHEGRVQSRRAPYRQWRLDNGLASDGTSTPANLSGNRYRPASQGSERRSRSVRTDGESRSAAD